MIHECIQRLEKESNVIRSYARELRQRADHIFNLRSSGISSKRSATLPSEFKAFVSNMSA